MENLSMPQDSLPKTVIPPNKECILHGITEMFVPQIAKCSLGGWIVVLQGKGIASFTTLEEAMHFVGDAAHEHMGQPKETIPEGIKPDNVADLEEAREQRRGLSVGSIVASLLAAVAVASSWWNARLW